MNVGAKLRELSRLHPPRTRKVDGARYGATGEVVGTSVSQRLDYQRQYYRDNRATILAAQTRARARSRAKAARELKKARAR